MGTFRSPFVRKDTTRGSRPVDGRLALAGLLTPADDVAALPGILSGLVVSGVAGQWYYAMSGGHGVTVRSATDGANLPGLDGVTNTRAVAAAPSTGSRYDLIYICQKDKEAGDDTSDAVIDVVEGDPGAAPSKPYASVPPGATVIAESLMAAGATGTLHANVVITQVAAKVGLRGGIIANPTTAQKTLLDAAASATNPIWIDDAGVLKRSVGSGFVTYPAAPTVRFKGYLNGGESVTVSTNMAFHVSEDTASAWDATNKRWVCPVAGTYLLIGSIKNNSTGAASSIRFLKNGSNAFVSPNFLSQAYGGGSATYYARLAVGDTIAMQSGASYACQSDAPGDNNFMEIVQVQV